MYKNEYEVKCTVDVIHVMLEDGDIAKLLFTKRQYKEAKQWIKKWGYHLWEVERGAGIRLEPHGYTIISVSADNDYYTMTTPLVDAVCYAAILLYRRLKRDNVI